MKILQITPSYKPAFIYGGPIVSIASMCEQLSIKCNLTVYSTLANGRDELDYKAGIPQLIDGVKVLFFRRQTKDHSHFSIGLLLAVWHNCRKFDVVHIHSWWNTVAVFSALICKIRNVKYVISPRGMFSNFSIHNSNSFFKSLIQNIFGNKLLFNQNFHATALSEKLQLENTLKSPKIWIIPNFVFLPKEDHTKRKDNTEFKMIFLSRIDPKKGLDLLINALRDLPINFQLQIVGNGDLEYKNLLKLKIKESELENRIVWQNAVYSNEKYQLLKNADLFILPSFDENFGNVVIESLAVGTPVLLSKEVGLSDVVLENDLGWVCELNFHSIRESIMNAYQNLEKREMIRNNASGILKRIFDNVSTTEKYLKMYQDIIDDER